MARGNQDVALHISVDDELYAEIADLAGQRLLHIVVWEDSLADELAPSPAPDEDESSFDIDLYLEDGIYFELYAVTLFDDPNSEPLVGSDTSSKALLSLVNRGGILEEIAVDEDEHLVLVLGRHHQPQLYLAVGGWLLEEWDELPT